jgi:hypothetical protein
MPRVPLSVMLTFSNIDGISIRTHFLLAEEAREQPRDRETHDCRKSWKGEVVKVGVGVRWWWCERRGVCDGLARYLCPTWRCSACLSSSEHRTPRVLYTHTEGPRVIVSSATNLGYATWHFLTMIGSVAQWPSSSEAILWRSNWRSNWSHTD